MNERPPSKLVKASYTLAKAFGWTPQQVREMTYGQVNLYLEMLKDDVENHGEPR